MWWVNLPFEEFTVVFAVVANIVINANGKAIIVTNTATTLALNDMGTVAAVVSPLPTLS